MAKQNTPSKRKPATDTSLKNKSRGGKPEGNIDKTETSVTDSTFFEKADSWIVQHSGKVLYACLFLSFVFSILLFDIRFSLAGDDSAYVERAFDFIHHFVFPSFQGPLYPLVLGPFVAVFGINSIPLKSLSLIFMLGFVWFMYKALKDRVPPLVLTITLILLSVNSSLLYYSSQTYTEAFFLFLQSITFYVFFKLFIDKTISGASASIAVNHLMLAALVLSLGLTRPIGFASVPAIALFFIFRRAWKNCIYFLGSFVLLLVLFLGIKTLIWGNEGLIFASQAGGFMAKDYYSPGAGREDVAGFINRLMQNSNYYISKTIFAFLGLRSGGKETAAMTGLTIITVLMFSGLLPMVFRRNLYLFFTMIYTAVSMVGIFMITQVIWIQDRYIISYFPLALLLLVSFFYYMLCLKNLTMFRFILPILSVFLLISTLRVSARDIQVVRQVRDQYSGLSPDWENYCRISEWTCNNLPAGSVVACRKPSISFIYSRGRNFFGIMKIPAISEDSLMQARFQKKQHFSFISNSSISSHPIPRELFNTFKQGIVGYGLLRKPATVAVPCYIMRFPDSSFQQIVQKMRNSNVEVTDNLEVVKSWYTESQYKITFVFTDTLVELLRKSKVTHVLTASLRADGTTKNGNTNNTVELYMEYIRYKYPNFMTKICQMGANDNEPAFLYKINYEQIKPESPR